MKNKIFVDLHTCIQGEGKYAGIPHILIRFSGCNLNCSWYQSICDTSYASWKPESPTYTLEDLNDLLNQYPQINHIMITGGEPSINKNLIPTIEFIRNKEQKYFITMETNGTHYVDNSSIDYLSISPKMSNSTPVISKIVKDYKGNSIEITNEMFLKHELHRNNYIETKKWIDDSKDFQLKFVYHNSIKQEILDLIKELNVSNKNVYIMPEGITNEQLSVSRKEIVDFCIEHGFNYTDRLHIVIYGNQRVS